METDGDNRRKQVALGAGILLVLTVTVVGLLTGWRYLPGLLGEWLGTVMGILTTPFILESSFFLLGLLIVIGLNTWRRHRDGDDFVYLEQVSGPELPADLPDHAKWAVYRETPLEAGEIPLLAEAEGALAIGDFAAAGEAIARMDAAELEAPATLVVRLELARATGHAALAGRLEARLREQGVEV